MKTEDYKLPVTEDYQLFSSDGKKSSSKFKICVIISVFLFLIITASVTIAFTFRSFNEMCELRHEIEILKTSLQNLENQNKMCVRFADLEYEDRTDLDLVDDYDDDNDDEDDDDINYITNSDEEYDDIIKMNENQVVFTGENFTKDAKETRNSSKTKRSIDGGISEERRQDMTERRNNHVTTPQAPSSYAYPSNLGMKISEDTNFSNTPAPRHSHTRRSRQGSSRQIVKKSLKSSDSQKTSGETSATDFIIVRDDEIDGHHTGHRRRHLENFDDRFPKTGRIRPLPTAHFSGDTSKYVLGQHDHYNGNGHLRHPQRTFVDWTESSWYKSLGMDRHFSLADGILTVKESGLYFIYAQIYYLDEHDMNGFRVYKNDDLLLQCTTMTHSVNRIMKANTCYTAAAEYLQENDRISLGDLSPSRYSLFEPGKSFFGVIKLGDVKIK